MHPALLWTHTRVVSTGSGLTGETTSRRCWVWCGEPRSVCDTSTRASAAYTRPSATVKPLCSNKIGEARTCTLTRLEAADSVPERLGYTTGGGDSPKRRRRYPPSLPTNPPTSAYIHATHTQYSPNRRAHTLLYSLLITRQPPSLNMAESDRLSYMYCAAGNGQLRDQQYLSGHFKC